MAIIGLSGYSGSGKDTFGRLIQYHIAKSAKDISTIDVISNYMENQWWLEEQSGWEIKKFAGKLKEIASLLTGIPIENFEDQEYKNTYLGDEWRVHGLPMKVREFLQYLGTNALRECLHQNTWVNALFADYHCVPADRAPGGWDCDNWIITDVRFPNEAKAIKDRGGLMIRIDKPFVKPVNGHSSETALDNWDFDYKVANVSDIISLSFTAETILQEQKLIL